MQKNPAPDHPHYRVLPIVAAVEKFPQATHVKEWLRNPRYGDYWKAYGVKAKYPQIKAPAYFITGWYDNLVTEGWRNFRGMREQAGSETARRGSEGEADDTSRRGAPVASRVADHPANQGRAPVKLNRRVSLLYVSIGPARRIQSERQR